jgi:hypothetical protein
LLTAWEVDMVVIKVYQKPDKPEFYAYVRSGKWGLLVEYPIDKPYQKRMAKWIDPNIVRIDWIREFV